MADPVVIVEGVSKKFCRSLKRSMFYGAIDATRSMFGWRYRTDQLRPAEFWALDGIDLEVARGENVGFLGVNGSGKSTMLRLITGIFPPDAGRIEVRGQVGALIAVGVGFHPHLTGRENIFLNGAILGMSQRELRERLDEIVAFAEIGDFIDAPVSTYSSGMTVRLGFSVAIHRQPTIMLVDEVLAVGDLAFQLKCQKKLADYRRSGGTFVIVSHNMQMIRNTCDRVIWLDGGRIVEQGEVHQVCDHYEDKLLRRAKQQFTGHKHVLNYDEQVHIEDVRFLDQRGEAVEDLQAGAPLTIAVDYRCERRVDPPVMTLALSNSRGVVVFESYSSRELSQVPAIEGSGRVEVHIEGVTLKPDVYFLSVTLSEGDMLNKLEWHEKSYMLQITNPGLPVNQGLIYTHPRWRFLE